MRMNDKYTSGLALLAALLFRNSATSLRAASLKPELERLLLDLYEFSDGEFETPQWEEVQKVLRAAEEKGLACFDRASKSVTLAPGAYKVLAKAVSEDKDKPFGKFLYALRDLDKKPW